jgi:AAA ATPase, central region
VVGIHPEKIFEKQIRKGDEGMARLDLTLGLIEAGLNGDTERVRTYATSAMSEERAKEHHHAADRIAALLGAERRGGASGESKRGTYSTAPATTVAPSETPTLHTKTPTTPLNNLILPTNQRTQIQELVLEQQHATRLQEHGLNPRNRILLKGPPGNGKTTLAEAIATELSVPLHVVHYEDVISSFLGETAGRLEKTFTAASGAPCVLFFDEFDVVAKERSDAQETGEVKRLVSTLLLQMDRLPAHTVFVAATNHANLLDSAVWRRFDLTFEMQPPSIEDAAKYWCMLTERYNLPDGAELNPSEASSFSAIEKQAQNQCRHMILHGTETQ